MSLVLSDRAALLRAIIDNPDEDTARLVYADCIEEEGDDARAEFIRVQVKLATMPEPLRAKKLQVAIRITEELIDDSWALRAVENPEPTIRERRREVLADRELELLDANWCAWRFDLPPDLRPFLLGAIRAMYRRGFISRLTCTWDQWQAHGAAIVAEHPVTDLLITDREPRSSIRPGEWYWYERWVAGRLGHRLGEGVFRALKAGREAIAVSEGHRFKYYTSVAAAMRDLGRALILVKREGMARA